MPSKNSILAGVSLIGTIIGAGIFGIPYLFARSGVLICFFYFLILGAVTLLVHLFFGEIVLRTRGKHRLTGYAERYLGKRTKPLLTFSIIVGTIGALLAYIILGGNFLKIIFPSSLSTLQFSLILWAALSFFVFLGIRSISTVEVFLNIGFFAIFILIVVFSLPKIETANFTLARAGYVFLPFGVLLFSLIGWNAVPEIESILKEKKNLKQVIIWSIMAALVFYFLFGLLISGVTGGSTSQEAFQGLVPVLGHKIMILGGLFGLLTISTSFLMLANYLKNTLVFDYRFPPLLAFFLACFSPLFLFLLGFREFIWIIAVVGTLVGVIEGITIALIFKKAKKQGERTPAYSLKISNPLLYFIIAVLALGAVSQIIYYFNV